MDDDSKSFVHRGVLVQAFLLTEWTKRPVPTDYLTVHGAVNKFGFVPLVIEAIDTAVKFARVLAAVGH